MEWMLLPLKRYAQFSGRSRRKEYWMFFLFVILCSIALGIIGGVLGLGGRAGAGSTPPNGASGFSYGAGVSGGLLANLFSLAMLIPGIAVAVRRLHDTDRSGWWLLLPVAPYVLLILLLFARIGGVAGGLGGGGVALIALIGLMALAFGILLLVWYCTAGTIGPNRFGADPKFDHPDEVADRFR